LLVKDIQKTKKIIVMTDFQQQCRNQLKQREITSNRRFKANQKYNKKLQGILNRKQKHLNDFPSVQQYLNNLFPNINISQVPICIVTHDDMSKLGICGAHGCYDKDQNIILIRNPRTIRSQIDTKFDQVMLTKIKSKIQIEDIVVHECIHAISRAANRSTGNFLFAEEEFVFTNCIDFYKAKGMSKEDIIQSVLLPFCVAHIMDNKHAMIHVFEEVKADNPSIKSFFEFAVKNGNQKYVKYLSIHAQKIVPVIVDFAKDLATNMIDIYNEFGKGIRLNSDRIGKHNNRFASIDMECDW